MNTRSRFRSINILLLLSFLLSACQLIDLDSGITGERRGGWIDWDEKGGWSDSSAALAEGVDAEERLFSAAPPEPEEAPPADTGHTRDTSNSQAPNLRAGSVDDNAEWDDYLLYRLRFAEWGIQVHDLDVTERHIIQVANTQGQPVLGAEVTVFDDRGDEVALLITHSDGTAFLFPNANAGRDTDSFDIVVAKDGAEVTATLDRDEREHEITLDADSASKPIRLDVHFLIDATGSMSDEISQLKDNMITVSERIEALALNPNVRFSMTIYRDRGDKFVSRTYDFTPDVEAFTDELSQVQADGGGDYPESLNEGLHNAIYLPEWRVEDTVSLIFLLADAPPHLDYSQDYDYAVDVFEAAERGIKIYPIASSGLDDQGEYIFRQLAQISGGKFLFLTYGAGGAPGDETTHHVDDYSVLSLDELVVRMVEEELAPLDYSQ